MRRTEGAFGFKRALFRDQEALTGQLTAFFVISLFLSAWALRPVERAWERQRQFVFHFWKES